MGDGGISNIYIDSLMEKLVLHSKEKKSDKLYCDCNYELPLDYQMGKTDYISRQS